MLTHKRFLFVYSEAHGWDFADANRSANPECVSPAPSCLISWISSPYQCFDLFIVVEEIFAFPGVGRLLIVAVQERDLTMLQAGALVMSVTYSLVNLFADMAYAYLDRRIQYD